jgi:hypothetical protein
VTLELLQSARNHHQFEEREASQSTFHHVPVTRSVQRAALTALRELHDVALAITASLCPTF